MSTTRGIDHLVVAVEDLDVARGRFAHLGFSTTPLGTHPWGTGNHLVQFPHNFIELLGVVDSSAIVPMSDGHFSFSAHNERFLRRREGMSMLVLSTEDARADARQWRERGLDVYEPIHWSRKAVLPDGRESTVAFTLAFVVDPLSPEIAFFSCQQHNPEAFWKAEYQAHENGATGIAGVTLVSERPSQHRAFFAALFDEESLSEQGQALHIQTARGVIRVATPKQCADDFPMAGSIGQVEGALFAAASIAIADAGRAMRCLESHSVPFARTGERIQIAGEHCCGLGLELAPAAPR